MSKDKTPCNDCHTLMMKGAGVVAGSSTKHGEYYRGPAICGVCSNSRYHDFVEIAEIKALKRQNMTLINEVFDGFVDACCSEEPYQPVKGERLAV